MSSTSHLATAIVALMCCAPIAAAAQSPGLPSAPLVGSMTLPGGVAAMLRATHVPGFSDPAAAIPGFIRAVHVLPQKPTGEAALYLGAVSRLAAAVGALAGQPITLPKTGSVPIAVREWADACGLTLTGGKLALSKGPLGEARRHALEDAGLPIAQWVEKVNAGESLRLDIGADDIPLPLTADWWIGAVLRRPVATGQLAAAILGDRRASFIYLGLMSLDDETLAYFGAHPALAAALLQQGAGAFAEWGRSLHIEKDRVQLPGGESTAAAWQSVVGPAPGDTAMFVRALMVRDGGRAAYFYDAVTHLDAGRRAYALAVAAGANAPDRVRALYAVVAGTKTILSDQDWPVVRHPFGPLAIVREVRVSPRGEMMAPAWRAFWEQVIGGNGQGCSQALSAGPPADAAWLAERIEREVLETRGHWVAAVAFAQRVFATAKPAELPAACEALAAFPTHDGLFLALEQTGLERPADYQAMLHFANRIWGGADRRAAVLRTAQAQAIVQALQQAVPARSLTPARARELLLSLSAIQAGKDGALPFGAVGQWMRETLLPAVCASQPSADACLARLVSGSGHPGGGSAPVSWEDDRYRIDLGAAGAVRIERVRAVQKATQIDEALNVLAAAALLADKSAGPAGVERATTILKAVTPGLHADFSTLFGHPTGVAIHSVMTALGASAQQLGEPARAAAGAASLAEIGEILLADALVSFAYAVAIGDPDDAVLMGGNPARGHLFDSTLGPATEAWHLPEEVQALDKSWLIEGSVLSLRTIYAKSWLRRLSIHDPGAAVRPDPKDVRVFGESVTAFNAFDLTDQDRDTVVGAIHKGRAAIAELAASPARLWKASREIGLGEWRCRAALWAREHAGTGGSASKDVSRFFSLSELLWLGGPDVPSSVADRWGASTRTLNGALTVRMPRTATWEDYEGPRGVGLLPTQIADVHLAVAEALAALKLPAVLAPDVAAQAVWDVMAMAQMAHRDDWYAVVRAAQGIPRDRFLDYVSALTATGPLVPLK